MTPGRRPSLVRSAGLVWLAAAVLHAAAESGSIPAAPGPESELPMLSLRDWISAPERPPAFLLADMPQVLVLAQPDLGRQGESFGRMVAFLEKSGLPRNRVPAQSEMTQWLQRTGQRIETLTYGNNLEASRLARFFNLARWQVEPLAVAESDLLQQLLRWRVLSPSPLGYVPGTGATMVITFPIPSELATCESCRVEEEDSLAVLDHEYQHARYVLDQALQHYTEWYWFNRVSMSQRQAVLRLLERRGYDTRQLSLVLDEFHAFLAQGRDGLVSSKQPLGEGPNVFEQLRGDFFNHMAVFEAGKGPAAEPPSNDPRSIQGERK